VLATEDRDFFRHGGIDFSGIARAMLANMKAGHVVQGGSTITQQLAKNIFLTPERTWSRKLREMLLAFEIESTFTKEEILSIYLNRVYLGAGTYGVDAAAQRYFGKSAREIGLPESAILAGLLKAPSRFAPTSNPELAQKRGYQVLINMQDAGFIDKKTLERATGELLLTLEKRRKTANSVYYFTDWIVDQLPEFAGNVEEDIVVTTTLRPDWQRLAEQTLADVLEKQGAAMDVSQGALLSMAPDGAVRAMVGGGNYGTSQFNRVTQAKRQPGSSFKPFVYLAALEAGFTPDSTVEDRPITIGKWSPQNYTGDYKGTMAMREALAQSINSVAVQLAQQVGIDRVVQMARRLGITSDLPEVPSLALGSTDVTLLEMTQAYAHLAASGHLVYAYGITKIRTRAGIVLYQREAQGTGSVLRGSVTAEMNDMLGDVIAYGTGRGANIGRSAAGKTGTTSDYRDAWFIGFTPQLVTGVWVGNDDNAPMKKVTGGSLPASIWRGFMAAALKGAPAAAIPTSVPDDGGLPWRAETPRGEGGFQLGPSFWNKLMNVEKTDYKYPEKRN